jgi:hypothetical protein
VFLFTRIVERDRRKGRLKKKKKKRGDLKVFGKVRPIPGATCYLAAYLCAVRFAVKGTVKCHHFLSLTIFSYPIKKRNW